ncbi:hypothetical protein F8S13_18595 [Chloroflexia bacterium SDU3-3]|nr:hypothetical protein F8S13_18595 [Chloroflexia bacterium SDU3-3]
MGHDELAALLYRGHGRAALVIQREGGAQHRAALLEACLHNAARNWLDEDERTVYLLGLIELTGEVDWFEERILDALAAFDEAAFDVMDIGQLFAFAAHYARAGSARARELLYTQFAAFGIRERDVSPEFSLYNCYGAERLISLDGLAGFRAAAERIGQHMLTNSQFSEDSQLINQLRDEHPHVTDAQILALAEDSKAVAHYLEQVYRPALPPASEQPPRPQKPPMPYAKLRPRLHHEQVGLSLRALARWAESAPADDLLAAANDLLAQTDATVLRHYLCLFDRVAFPLGPAPLVGLARHLDERVAMYAVNALSLFHDPALHDLAIEMIDAGERPWLALRLLIESYRAGDDAFILAVLDGARDDEDVHQIGYAVEKIMARHTLPSASAILMQLYERQPCSICRADAVTRLADMGAVSPMMAAECRHDASERTRALAARLA